MTVGGSSNFGSGRGNGRYNTSLLRPNLAALYPRLHDHGGYEGDEGGEGDEGDEGRCAGDDRGRSHEKDRGVRGSQTEGREGRACCIDCHRNCRGEEDGEVRDPAGLYAQAEAQACTEGGDEAHVRRGEEGGGEAGHEGGQSFRREGSQGLDLSDSHSMGPYPSKQQDSVGVGIAVDLQALSIIRARVFEQIDFLSGAQRWK